MRKLLLAVVAVASLALAPSAAAATTTLEGGATQVNGAIQLVSNSTVPASGILVGQLGGLTVQQLRFLGTEFQMVEGTCANGSPRFAVTLASGRTVQIYLGEYNAATGTFTCPTGQWLNTGNILTSTDPRFDLTQLGGPFYGTYQQFLQLAGTQTISAIRLVTDSFPSGGPAQRILVRNLVVNTSVVAPTIKNTMAPGQVCKALRTTMNAAVPGSFAQTFGTNRNRANAMGKCASMVAHLKKAGVMPVATAVLASAVTSCAASGKTGTQLRPCVFAALRALMPSVTTAAIAASNKPANDKANNGNKGKGKKKP